MKKKLLSIIMALLLLFSFAACGDTQESEEAAQANATVAEETTAEPTTAVKEKHPDAISWKKAYDHVGEKVTIMGTVKGIFQSTSSKGKPTFVNIGKDYPESGRVTVVIWEENLSDFDDLYSYDDEKVYVTGKIYMYDGVAQIEVSDQDQIEVE